MGNAQIGILTLKKDFSISSILPFGKGEGRGRKIRTVGISNLSWNCLQKSQGFALQHQSTD